MNELVETAYALEERVGVQLGPIVVNGVDDGAAIDVRRGAPTVLADAAPEGAGVRSPASTTSERTVHTSSNTTTTAAMASFGRDTTISPRFGPRRRAC